MFVLQGLKDLCWVLKQPPPPSPQKKQQSQKTLKKTVFSFHKKKKNSVFIFTPSPQKKRCFHVFLPQKLFAQTSKVQASRSSSTSWAPLRRRNFSQRWSEGLGTAAARKRLLRGERRGKAAEAPQDGKKCLKMVTSWEVLGGYEDVGTNNVAETQSFLD